MDVVFRLDAADIGKQLLCRQADSLVLIACIVDDLIERHLWGGKQGQLLLRGRQDGLLFAHVAHIGYAIHIRLPLEHPHDAVHCVRLVLLYFKAEFHFLFSLHFFFAAISST